MAVHFKHHEKLNVFKLKEYNKELIHLLALDNEELDEINNEINETNDCNYKFIRLNVFKPNYETNHSPSIEITYNIIHGFPGDEAVGYILLGNGLYEKIGSEKINPRFDVALIDEWYKEETLNGCDFVHKYWY